MTLRGNGDRDFVQSIERGFAVLNAFGAERPTATLAEIAEATDLSRPAVRRILLTLQRLGYVDGQGGRWWLTPRVLSIGAHYTAAHALLEVSQPHLRSLAAITNESASLAALDGADVVYIARVAVRRIMSISVEVGSRVPAFATSMGRVLLAWAHPDQVARALDQAHLRAFTAKTRTSPEALRRELARVRAQGFAIVDQELEVGLLAASAPVRDPSGTVVAALASSTTPGRSTPAAMRRELVPLLCKTADAIGEDLRRSTH